MLSFTGHLRIFVWMAPCDMRKSYDGLTGLVHQFHQELRSGSLFVFSNRQRTRLKILYFDGTGLWVLQKRLEKGTFGWPKGDQAVLHLRPEVLAMLIDGIDMNKASMRPWYDREK